MTQEILPGCPVILHLAIGLEDYTADLGTQRTLQGSESFFARSMLLNAARAASIRAGSPLPAASASQRARRCRNIARAKSSIASCEAKGRGGCCAGPAISPALAHTRRDRPKQKNDPPRAEFGY